MSDPNALWARMRRRLVKMIEPVPDAGEAWCIGCCLNKGQSLVIAPNGVQAHLQQHPAEKDAVIQVAQQWPYLHDADE